MDVCVLVVKTLSASTVSQKQPDEVGSTDFIIPYLQTRRQRLRDPVRGLEPFSKKQGLEESTF